MMRVAIFDAHTTRYLALDQLAANPSLARRLPPELAWRFHALPVAEHEGRITVAMANPDDPAARQAVATSLGPAPCLVQADPLTIDAVLAEVWGSQRTRSLHVSVCAFPTPVADEVLAYAQSFSNLLDARLTRVSTIGEMQALDTENGEDGHDLLIVDAPTHPVIHRLLARPSTARTVDLPAAVLVACRPCWPLRRILLVLGGVETDCAAVDWVLRLARASASAVTALAVVPPVPAMYERRAGMDQGLPVLLTAQTPLGRQLRQAARQLVEWEIEGTLRLRQGPPDLQIQRELAEKDYSLIALAAQPGYRWQRWLEGDLVRSLLQRAGRPVLVARPKTA
jgi:nucleotide-binding universal stress UspA family protein